MQILFLVYATEDVIFQLIFIFRTDVNMRRKNMRSVTFLYIFKETMHTGY